MGYAIAVILFVILLLARAMGLSPVTIGVNGMRLIAHWFDDIRETIRAIWHYIFGPDGRDCG